MRAHVLDRRPSAQSVGRRAHLAAGAVAQRGAHAQLAAGGNALHLRRAQQQPPGRGLHPLRVSTAWLGLLPILLPLPLAMAAVLVHSRSATTHNSPLCLPTPYLHASPTALSLLLPDKPCCAQNQRAHPHLLVVDLQACGEGGPHKGQPPARAQRQEQHAHDLVHERGREPPVLHARVAAHPAACIHQYLRLSSCSCHSSSTYRSTASIEQA